MRIRLIVALFMVQGGLLVASVEGDRSSLIGEGLPISARVVSVRDPGSVRAFTPVSERVERMVERGILQLSGRATLKEAWQSFVSTQDTVGIKVYSSPGATIGTRPSVVAAVVRGLLEAGLPAAQIVIWDRHLADLRSAGFVDLAERYGVRAAGSADAGYDPDVFYDNPVLGKLVWGDKEFGRIGAEIGRNSYVSKLVTQELTQIIQVTPLLNHNAAGVSGNLFGLALGSVDNVLRFEHSPERLAQAIPEIYALPELGDRVVLSIVDALICQYQGEQRMLLHYAAMLGELRFSTDPVALDVLSMQELHRQRQLAGLPVVKQNWLIYTNASLLEIGVSDPRRIVLIQQAIE